MDIRSFADGSHAAARRHLTATLRPCMGLGSWWRLRTRPFHRIDLLEPYGMRVRPRHHVLLKATSGDET